MTFGSRIAAAIAIVLSGCLLGNVARADTASFTTTVGLVRNDGGELCAIGTAAGSELVFGKVAWNAVAGDYEFADGGVKNIGLWVVNTMSSRICRVDVRGAALRGETDSIPIYDVKLEESEASDVAVETVPRVPDQEAWGDVPVWLIREASGGQCAVVKATLSSRHIAEAPVGAFTGLITLTGSASAP